MPDVFLDSSVLIGLHFRHAGERAACAASFPQDSNLISSRYVVFEIARGFLRSLMELHNASFEFGSFSDLHLAAYSGQMRFKPYKMHTWLGAMTDCMAALEKDGASFTEPQRLAFFRSKLRVWVQTGWKNLLKSYQLINDIACQNVLLDPSTNHDGMLVQQLPVLDCGKPNVCGIQYFIQERQNTVRNLADHLSELPKSKKGNDTDKKHVDGMRYLLAAEVNQPFMGAKCHRCGDALICLEAPANSIVVTKNQKDFQPITEYLGKRLMVAITAATTIVPAAKEPGWVSTQSTKFVRWFKALFGK